MEEEYPPVNQKVDEESPASDNLENNKNYLVCNDCGKPLRSLEAAQLHAARTQHANFSQSAETVKPLTEEEKKQKLEELKQKLAAKRAEQAKIEEQEAKERERLRRMAGKDISKAKEEFQHKEMMNAAAQRKKEKQEELEARRRIKMQIEADRLERAARAKSKSSTGEDTSTAASPRVEKKVEGGTEIKKVYDETRIQIRVASRPPIIKNFGANDKLGSLVEVLNNEGLHGTLVMTFPRKSFATADYSKTFQELGLVPSASLILQ